jgi:NAD(P)H-nitrite reductase large subunit
VYVLRSLDQALAIRETARRSRSALVVGAGLVSVKTADALVHLGLRVLMISASPQVLSRSLNREAAVLAADRLRAAGVEIRYQVDVESLNGQNGCLCGARLTDGISWPCELLVAGKGVTPNAGLLKECGVGEGTGVLADLRQRTSLPDIYVAGDVCESYQALTGERDICANWPTAVRQGRVAGVNMAGGNATYNGNLPANVFEFGGLSFGTIGDIGGLDGVQVHSCSPDKHGRGTWLYERDGRLVGAVLTGDIRGFSLLEGLIRKRCRFSGAISDLLVQPQSYVATAATSGGYIFTGRQH